MGDSGFLGVMVHMVHQGFPETEGHLRAIQGPSGSVRLEGLGIDCRDSKDAWKAAVAKYELPWVNVYKEDSNTALLESYGVQGFPTKAIVNPEGKIVDITTGEDPSFYDRLASFISRQ